MNVNTTFTLSFYPPKHRHIPALLLIFGAALFGSLNSLAQAPPLPTSPEAIRQQRIAQLKTNALLAAAGTNSAAPPRTSPRAIPTLRPDSIAVPSNPTNAAPRTGTRPPAAGAVAPATTATPANNPAMEEIVTPAMMDFRGVDLGTVLNVYADMVNRTILRAGTLPATTPIWLTTH